MWDKSNGSKPKQNLKKSEELTCWVQKGKLAWWISKAKINVLCALFRFVVVGHHMMTSSNGNIFRVTGHLCGEFTGLRWIPRTKASDAELWCFLWSVPDKRLSKQSWGWWLETQSGSLWRHSNEPILPMMGHVGFILCSIGAVELLTPCDAVSMKKLGKSYDTQAQGNMNKNKSQIKARPWAISAPYTLHLPCVQFPENWKYCSRSAPAV